MLYIFFELGRIFLEVPKIPYSNISRLKKLVIQKGKEHLECKGKPTESVSQNLKNFFGGVN